uniref:Uncharacterized protein n=1 Tax=Parascaris equorum TaxID=6256 RepID=A0A914R0J7_PAREQ
SSCALQLPVYIAAQDAQHLTVENLGERFNVTVAVSNGANEVDTAVVMVSLEPRTDLESSAPKFTQVSFASKL